MLVFCVECVFYVYIVGCEYLLVVLVQVQFEFGVDEVDEEVFLEGVFCGDDGCWDEYF